MIEDLKQVRDALNNVRMHKCLFDCDVDFEKSCIDVNNAIDTLDRIIADFAAPTPAQPEKLDVNAITEIAWEAFFNSDKPAPYNQMKDAITRLAANYDFVRKVCDDNNT